MLANLPKILSCVKKEKTKEAAGMMGLFGDPEVEDLNLIELPDWDVDTKLYYERQALGAFLTGHPMDRVADKVERAKVTHSLRDFDAMMECHNRDRVVVAGLVEKVEPRGRITLLELSDRAGRVELIMFSDEAQRLAHCVMRNAMIVAKLRPRHNGDRRSLQVLDAYRIGHFRTPQ